jgi:hypothetical protein
MLATIVIPNSKKRDNYNAKQTIVFLFTGNNKCAYLPNERRIQIIKGEPVFPHDGRRYSYTFTDFTLKKVKKTKTYICTKPYIAFMIAARSSK